MTLDVRARKVVVDDAGVETEVPMDDLVEVGVFARRKGKAWRAAVPADAPRALRQAAHHRDGAEPAGRAGIDPRRLLIDVERDDNLEEVARSGALPAR